VARPTHCLRCIELFGPNGAPMIVWRGESRGTFDAIEPLLRPAGRLAGRYPPPRPGWPTMRVVEHRDGRFVAVCDEEVSDRIELTREDVVVHRIDEGRLRSRIAEALGLEISREPINSLPGVLRIGTWIPKPAARFRVSLVVPASSVLFCELLTTEFDREEPSIVLTLSTLHWSDRAAEIAAANCVTLVPCDDIIDPEAKWTATERWAWHQGAFLERAGVKLADPYRNRTKKARTALAGGNAAKVKAELNGWYRSARAALIETGSLPEPPTQKHLAELAGISESTVSRLLNARGENADRELAVLWNGVRETDAVRRFRG